MRRLLFIILLVVVLSAESVLAQQGQIGYQRINTAQPGMIPLYNSVEMKMWSPARGFYRERVTVDAYIQWIVPSRPTLDYYVRSDSGAVFIINHETLTAP